MAREPPCPFEVEMTFDVDSLDRRAAGLGLVGLKLPAAITARVFTTTPSYTPVFPPTSTTPSDP